MDKNSVSAHCKVLFSLKQTGNQGYQKIDKLQVQIFDIFQKKLIMRNMKMLISALVITDLPHPCCQLLGH